MRKSLIDDCTGILGITNTHSHAWAKYELSYVPGGSYTFEIRVKPFQAGTLEIKVNEQIVATWHINQDMVGEKWLTLEESLILPHEEKTLTLQYTGTGTGSNGMLHINWLKLLSATSAAETSLNTHSVLHVYPNPCKDNLMIRTYRDINKIYIMDTSGRLIMEHKVYGNFFNVPVHTLNPGVFLMRIQFADRIEYARFIKI
jgi:hypothetical protein